MSVLTGVPVKRDTAMTGEITLRGRVLPIGGLKEKLLAALRGGLKTVLIPAENEKDLAEIPDNVKRGLKIIPARTVDEVLGHALTEALTPIEWDEDTAENSVIPAQGEQRSGLVTHWRASIPSRSAGKTDPAGRQGRVNPWKIGVRFGAVTLTRSGPGFTLGDAIGSQPFNLRSGGNT